VIGFVSLLFCAPLLLFVEFLTPFWLSSDEDPFYVLMKESYLKIKVYTFVIITI
jgi:hypothetical protein